MNKKLSAPRLGIVLPCYNEEKILPNTFKDMEIYIKYLINKGKISANSFLYFIDDGSTDKTWQLIKQQHYNSDGIIKALKLTNNVGHQNALLAGMLSIKKYKVDCVITIDADLQDDISVIEKMIDAYVEGNEIVYGVKEQRNVDALYKKYTARFFYWLISILGVKIIKEHADFRLCSNKVLSVLSNYPERNLFLRAIFPTIGFTTKSIYYTIRERKQGKTKYSLIKMLALAWNGITSFSIIPLRIVTIVGAFIFIMSAIMGIYVLSQKFYGEVIQGWTSIILPIYFLGGIQLLSIGILGEYLAKIYIETKNRPRYIKEEEIS